MNKLKKIILYFLNIPLFWISTVIPKRNNIWIFGAWMGQRYADNSKYLFEYVNQHCPNIRAVWLTKNRKVLNAVTEKGFEAYLCHSLKGIIAAMRSRIAVITHGKRDDFLPFISPRQTSFVQLFHGIPLKKINYDDKITWFPFNEHALSYRLKMLIKRIGFPFLIEEYSMVLATSEETRKIFASAFRTSPERVKICGYPRNDTFFKFKKTLLIERDDIDHIGIYMPTYRGDYGSDPDLFTGYGFDAENMERFLSVNRTFLFLKPHPLNHPPAVVSDKLRQSKHIQFLEVDDTYSYMNQFDFLITDYSSIYFDYLLLDRPIIFAPFDLEAYLKQERELYFDYREYTPGPMAKNWDEVLHCLEESLKNPKKYSAQRTHIREKFHQFADGQSCQRVLDELIQQI
jgi:CDP-glycerol glycerophosphotransferase